MSDIFAFFFFCPTFLVSWDLILHSWELHQRTCHLQNKRIPRGSHTHLSLFLSFKSVFYFLSENKEPILNNVLVTRLLATAMKAVSSKGKYIIMIEDQDLAQI